MSLHRSKSMLEGHAEMLWYEWGAKIPWEYATAAQRRTYLKLAEEELSEIVGPDGADA